MKYVIINSNNGSDCYRLRSTERLQVRGGTDSFISHIRETQTTEGTDLKIQPEDKPMNTLALIKEHLTRKAKVEAYNKSIAYRGVKYTPSNEVAEAKGCYVYRGRTYCK